MSKKFGLGKGLGALIPEENNETQEVSQGTQTISLNLIKNNSEQPRKHFDEEKIAELAESIKHNGIVQPLVLTANEDGTYTIVAGERRWRASKMLGLKEVPAIVMELTDKQVLEISIIENIQRQDLNPIEEAVAYKKLMTEFNLTQDELSQRVGKSRVAIANTLRLVNLDQRVQQYIIESVLSEGHGRALLVVEDNELQYTAAQKAIDEKFSVRELEKYIKSLFTVKKVLIKPEEPTESPYVKDVQNRLQEHLGTKVRFNFKKNKRKIEIEYYSDEDLERLLEIMNVE